MDSPMPELPEFNSQRAVDALNKFNKIKKATSSTEIMTMDEMYAASLIFSGKGIDQFYYISEMPGEIKGIHGSCLTGYNIGVAKYLSQEKPNAAIEIVKFFSSEENQKELIFHHGIFS